MTDSQIEEAVTSVTVSPGASSYLHGVDYSEHQFKEELRRISGHMKNGMKVPASK